MKRGTYLTRMQRRANLRTSRGKEGGEALVQTASPVGRPQLRIIISIGISCCHHLYYWSYSSYQWFSKDTCHYGSVMTLVNSHQILASPVGPPQWRIIISIGIRRCHHSYTSSVIRILYRYLSLNISFTSCSTTVNDNHHRLHHFLSSSVPYLWSQKPQYWFNTVVSTASPQSRHWMQWSHAI